MYWPARIFPYEHDLLIEEYIHENRYVNYVTAIVRAYILVYIKKIYIWQ